MLAQNAQTELRICEIVKRYMEENPNVGAVSFYVICNQLNLEAQSDYTSASMVCENLIKKGMLDLVANGLKPGLSFPKFKAVKIGTYWGDYYLAVDSAFDANLRNLNDNLCRKLAARTHADQVKIREECDSRFGKGNGCNVSECDMTEDEYKKLPASNMFMPQE